MAEDCVFKCMRWEVSGETETFPKSAWWSETAQHHWCQHSVWWLLACCFAAATGRQRIWALHLLWWNMCCRESMQESQPMGACLFSCLVTEVDTKEVDERGKHVTSKDRIIKQCKVRADDWANVVMMRVTSAPVTCMHHTQDIPKCFRW